MKGWVEGWIKRWKRRIRTLIRRDAVERELDEELAFHLGMETQKNLREGMSPEEARRQAAIKFGGVERYKEKVREARVLGWVSGMLLDFKLGFRMLLKYPGLTFAGGIGIAVAIAIAGGFFTFSHSYFYPTIPLPEGDRLVGLENWDLSINNENRRSIHDFYIWSEELESVEDMSAFTDVAETLIGADGTVEEIRVAHMTPSGLVTPHTK